MTFRPNVPPRAAFGVRILAAATLLMLPLAASAHDELPAHHKVLPSTATEVMKAFFATAREKLPLSSVSGPDISTAAAACTLGEADPGTTDPAYPCDGIDLQSFLALDDIGGTRSNSEANDIWGWTAPDGSEYAIIGRVFGTSFVDITIPTQPLYLGDLPTHGAFGSSWRDIKVYANHAFVVSEALNHGMQVFDLTQLQDQAVIDDALSGTPRTFAETAHYSGGAASHNLHINEDTGYAYMVGNSGKRSCSGGLHMVDIGTPTSPSFAGCYSGDGYTHDVQCVVYNGPDTAHQGREICFASNEDTVTIVDVTDKANPVQLSRTPYPGASYTHQGWLSGDHEFFVLDDELDEFNGVVGTTTTRILDVSDLDNPRLSAEGEFQVNPDGSVYADGVYTSANTSIDHNLYMVGGCAVQANYRSGLRIVDVQGAIGVPGGAVQELGFFDIWPPNDDAQFNGMWSSYAFFPSGNIIASGIEQGLYVLKPSFGLAAACGVNTAPVVAITAPEDGFSVPDGTPIDFIATVSDAEDATDPTASWTTGGAPITDLDSDGNPNTLTALLSVGTHVVTAAATDNGGVTGSASITVVVTPVVGGTDMRVGVMTGGFIAVGNRRWTGEVTIPVEQVGGGAVSDATVTGTWSGGAKGGGSCTTDGTGTCSVTKAAKLGNTLTFTVTGVTHATLTYVPEADDFVTIDEGTPAPP